MYTVYEIEVISTGRSYFGSSISIKKRWTQHRCDLKRKKHHCINLQNSFDVVGLSGLNFSVVESGLSKIEAHILEEFLIASPVALNIGLQAVGGDNFYRHPFKSTIQEKISISLKRAMKALTPKERKIRYGQPNNKNNANPSQAQREAARTRAVGNKWAAGCKRTESHKKQLSKLASKRVGNSNPFFGKHHTEKTKDILREKRKGKLPSNSRSVVVEGVEYISSTEAGRSLGVCTATVLYRIKSKNFNYYYKD